MDPSDPAGHGASERDKGNEREVDDGISGEPRAKEAGKRIKARGWEKKEQERETRSASLLKNETNESHKTTVCEYVCVLSDKRHL